MSTTFPSAASFAGMPIAPPPALRPDQSEGEQLQVIQSYLTGLVGSLIDMQSSIESGWLIDTVRILNLNADTITSGTIFTQDLYVGEGQNIQLLGTTDRIDIYDDQGTPVLRTRLGNLGAGASNFGIEGWDSSGTLIFSVGDTVFISGTIITDATIANAKLVNSTITGAKVASNTIADGNIVSLGATKITGTLTLDGNPSCLITSSGAMTFQSGGDIIMKASGTNFSYIQFQDSSGSGKMVIIYNSTGNYARIQAQGTGTDLQLLADVGDVVIQSGTDDYVFGGQCASDIQYAADGTYDIGSSSVRAANVWSDLINGADYGLDNGLRIVEPDKIRDDLDPNDGFMVVNQEWEVMMWVHKDGSADFAGPVRGNQTLPVPNISRLNATDKELEDLLFNELLEQEDVPPHIHSTRYRQLKKQARLKEKEINGRRPFEEARQDSRRTENRRRVLQ